MDEMDVSNPGEDDELKNKVQGDIEIGKSDDELEDESRMIEDKQKVSENEESEHGDLEEEDAEDSGDEDDIDEAEVKSLETMLAENPFDYASHIALINKLRKMGELERLRAARENMSEKYPLSPELWLEWIQDEIKLATTPEEKNIVIQLCERAVIDYLCKFYCLQ